MWAWSRGVSIEVAVLGTGEGKDILEVLLVLDDVGLDVHRQAPAEAGVIFVAQSPAAVVVADLVERYRTSGGIGMLEKRLVRIECPLAR
jgi:hypothetical protein